MDEQKIKYFRTKNHILAPFRKAFPSRAIDIFISNLHGRNESLSRLMGMGGTK